MITIHCASCGDEIMEKAALLLGPPITSQGVDYTAKRHLCRKCHVFVLKALKIPILKTDE